MNSIKANNHMNSLVNICDLTIALFVVFFLTNYIPFMTHNSVSFLFSTPLLHRMVVILINLFLLGSVYLFIMKIVGFKDWLSRTRFKGLITISKNNPLTLIIILYIYFSLLYFLSSYLRHISINSGFDLAIFSQAIRNINIHGIQYSSIKGGISLLGDHFSPLLYLLGPLHSVCQTPAVLLFIQCILAMSSVFPLYLLSKRALTPNNLALILAIIVSFTIYLPLRNSMRFDFHPEVIAMPFFFWAFYFLHIKKSFAMFISLGIVLLSKESAALSVCAFGLYSIIAEKNMVSGIIIIIFSSLYFYLCVFYFIPFFSGQAYQYLGGNYLIWIDKGLVAFLNHFVSIETLSYLIKIMGPIGFLCLLSPTSLILGLPVLLQNLLSTNEATRSIFFQYTAFLTPAIFFALIMGIAKIKASNQSRLITYLLFMTIIFSGVSEWQVIRQSLNELSAEDRYVREFLSNLGEDLSLRTHEFYAPHAINRNELHIFENDHPREGGRNYARFSDVIFVDMKRFNERSEIEMKVLFNRGYKILSNQNGIVVMVQS